MQVDFFRDRCPFRAMSHRVADQIVLDPANFRMLGSIEMLQQPRKGMPLRYNKDKRKNPVFSRVSAFVVAYSIPFPTLIVNEESVE